MECTARGRLVRDKGNKGEPGRRDRGKDLLRMSKESRVTQTFEREVIITTIIIIIIGVSCVNTLCDAKVRGLC